MLVHIPIYTGQQKFDVNANAVITYRALKGEEIILYYNYAYDKKKAELYYTIRKRLRWLDYKICYMCFSLH